MANTSVISLLLDFKANLGALQKFTGEIQRRLQAVQEYNKSVQNGAAALTHTLQAAAAVLAVGRLKQYAQDAMEAARGQAQLRQALQKYNQDSVTYRAELRSQAQALQDKTGIDDDEITKIQQQLVYARVQKADMRELTALTIDFATAKGIDVVNASKIVERALRGEGEEMRRYGVELGDGADRLAAVKRGLESFKGQAEGAFNALPQDVRRFQIAANDASKTAGSLVLAVTGPWLSGLAEGLQRATARMEQMRDEGSALLTVFTKLSAVAGTWIGKNLDRLLLLAGAFLTLKAVMYVVAQASALLGAAFVALAGQPFLKMVRLVQWMSGSQGVFAAVFGSGMTWATGFAASMALASAALAGFTLGSFINELELGGRKVSDWSALVLTVLMGWAVEAKGAIRKGWASISYAFTEFLPAIKITLLEFLVWVGEKFNNRLGEKLGFKIPTAGLKESLGAARLEMQRAADEHLARLRTIDAETRIAAADIAGTGDYILATTGKGQPAGAAAKGSSAGGSGGAPDKLVTEELAAKRELFQLETKLILAKAQHNQLEIDRIERLLEAKKLEQEIKDLKLQGTAAADQLAARQAAADEARKTERAEKQEMVGLETQRQQAEVAGNQIEMDRIDRLIREKQLKIELQELGAAAIPLIQARLAAEDAARAKQRAQVEQERVYSQKLGEIAIRRADIEGDLYSTADEKQRAILPLLREENDLIAERIALLEAELAQGASDERRGTIMGQLDDLRSRRAANTREQGEMAPQSIGDGIDQGVRGKGGFLESLGTAAQNAASMVSGGLNAALQGTSDLLYNVMSGAMSFSQAWKSAIVGVGQSFLRLITDMVAKLIWRATIERALVAMGVVTHVAGEQAKTTATVAGGTIRLGVVIKEALASVYHGAVAAFSAMASIPYVGPILAVAAMAAALAGGIALVSKIAGHAEGGIIRGPGGPKDDLITTRLSNGEAVTRASSVSRFGEPFFNALNRGVLDLALLPNAIQSSMARPSYGYAGGGGNGARSSGGWMPSAAAATQQEFNANVAIFDDSETAAEWLASGRGQKRLIRTRRNRGERT